MKLYWLTLFSLLMLSACNNQIENNQKKSITWNVLDTDFSKGRLLHHQKIELSDLEKFHGHLCDGLILGSLAFNEAIKELYPNDTIDRTNLRIISQASPCISDVAVYLSGGRYQFNSFYVDGSQKEIYRIQRLDNRKAVSVSIKDGVKPYAIDSMGVLATQNLLSACELDFLHQLEDDFSEFLFRADASTLFKVNVLHDFTWESQLNIYPKTDVLNKNALPCTH